MANIPYDPQEYEDKKRSLAEFSKVFMKTNAHFEQAPIREDGKKNWAQIKKYFIAKPATTFNE